MIQIVNIFTGIFEAIVAMMLISTYCPKTTEKTSLPAVLGVVALSVLINVSNLYLNIGIFNMFFIMLMFFCIFYIYSKNFRVSAILAIVLILVLLVAEVLVMFGISYIANVNAETATNHNTFRILGIVMSKLLGFLIIKYICDKHRSSAIPHISGKYWLLFFLIFVVSSLSIYLLFIYQYNSTTPSVYDDLAVWCSIGILYSTLFSLYLYENVAIQSEVLRENTLYEQQIKAQSKHLEEMLVTQDRLKTLRHDLKNHCIAISSFMESSDNENGLKYVSELNSIINSVDASFDTGNIALDSILGTKKTIAEKEGIDFVCKLQVPENLFVDPVDVCIIFGNALDNSIEACRLVEEGKRYIHMSLIYDDTSLICKIANSALNQPGNFLKTTKKDFANHGLGIKSIETSLKKYGAKGIYSQTDNEFVLSFLMFENS